MRILVHSGAVFLACGFSVFGRPLSARDWISQLLDPGDAASTTGTSSTDNWTNFLRGSSDTPYFAPLPQYQSSQVGYATTSSPQYNPLEGIPITNTISQSAGLTIPTEPEPEPEKPLIIDDSIQLNLVVSKQVEDTFSTLAKTARYCLYVLSSDNSNLDPVGSCAPAGSNWNQFSQALENLPRPGIGLYKVGDPSNSLLSVPSLFNKCKEPQTGGNTCVDEAGILEKFENDWIASVQTVFRNVQSQDPVSQPSELATIGGWYKLLQ